MNIFKGRLNRTTYLLINIIIFVITGIFATSGVQHYLDAHDATAIMLGIVVGIPIFIWQISASARRLHDRGVSGWFSLLVIIPGAELILCILPGEKGVNRYGAPHSKKFDVAALLTTPCT
jgi:uncharacterized membrane protein YhaH (DUF805 family)